MIELLFFSFLFKLLLKASTHYLFLGSFCSTFLPTFQIKERALVTAPGEFLRTDIHVFGEGSGGFVMMFFDDGILEKHGDTTGDHHIERNFNPRPQFLPFLVVRFVWIGRQDFLLIRDPCTDLINHFRFHFGFGPDLRYGLDGSCPCGSEGGDGTTAASPSSCTHIHNTPANRE